MLYIIVWTVLSDARIETDGATELIMLMSERVDACTHFCVCIFGYIC